MKLSFFSYIILLFSLSAFSMFEPGPIPFPEVTAQSFSNKRKHSDIDGSAKNKKQRQHFDEVYIYPWSLFETLFADEENKAPQAKLTKDDAASLAQLRAVIEDPDFDSRMKRFQKLFSVTKEGTYNKYIFWIEVNARISCKVTFVPAGKKKLDEYWIDIEEFSTLGNRDKWIGDLFIVRFRSKGELKRIKDAAQSLSEKSLKILDHFITTLIDGPQKPIQPKPSRRQNKGAKVKAPAEKPAFDMPDSEALQQYVATLKQPTGQGRMEGFWQNLPFARLAPNDLLSVGLWGGNILPVQVSGTSGLLQMVQGDYYSEALAARNFPECAAEHDEKHDQYYYWKLWEVVEDQPKPVLNIRVCEHMGELVKIHKGTKLSGNQIARFFNLLFPLFKVPVIEYDDMHFMTPQKVKISKKITDHAYLCSKIWDIAVGNDPWYVRKLGFTEVIDVKNWIYSAAAHETVRGKSFSQEAMAYFKAVNIIQTPISLEEFYTWKGISRTNMEKIVKRVRQDHSVLTLQDLLRAVSTRQRRGEAGKIDPSEQQQRDQDSYDLSLNLLTGYGGFGKGIPEGQVKFFEAVDIINGTHVFSRPVEED